MNKIISMSVWGDNPRYIIGAKRQVELAEKYYPDWKVRVYTDDPFKLTDIKDKAEIHKISDGSYGMFWRFLPMFESPDNITMVRDSDSRITIREARCIEEWMNSDKSFHTFKDHDAHYEFPIIGCAFAYKGAFNNDILRIMINFMNQHKYYLSDQFFLRDYIWPAVKNNTLLHSMNEPGWFSETRKKLVNRFSFCGNGYDERDMPLYEESLEANKTFDPKWVADEYKFDEGILDD
jgi:protein O-GlcNAc transferase